MKFVLLVCLLTFVNTKHIFNWHDTVRLHSKDAALKIPHDLYEVNENNHIFNEKPDKGVIIGQGDIAFKSLSEEKKLFSSDGVLKRDALKDERAKWPGAVVPYVISQANDKGRKAITAAIQEYKDKTCIKFVPRTTQRDYVNIFVNGGCYSYVGRIGGKQDVSIGRGCEFKTTVVHEFMHALGFFHEQSRVDRDSFVKIITANIQSGYESQFTKQNPRNVQDFGHPYDYDSVMHYDKYAFSTDYGRLATIEAIGDPNRNFGQGFGDGGLSAIDAKQLNAMYCGGEEVKPKTTKKPTTTNGLNVAKCLNRMKYCQSSMSKCRKVFAEL